MDWSSAMSAFLLLFWTLLPQRVHCLEEAPDPVDECISEAKAERLEILANLIDLKSSVHSLHDTVSTLSGRVKSIEELVKESEAKTAEKIDSLERELSEKVTQESVERRSHEWALASNFQDLAKEFNSTMNSLVKDLEAPVAELGENVRALLEASREERANRSTAQEEIDPSQQDLQTVVNATSIPVEDQTVTVSTEEMIGRKELMLKHPRATFFTGENMTGEAVEYDSTNSTWAGGCHNVGGIKSMRISEACVRVFKSTKCHQMSRSLYPKPNSGGFINFLTTELPEVKSIGPCLPNEFQFWSSSLHGSNIALTKNESNVHQVPDFVDFTGRETYFSKSMSVDSSSNPISRYYMDQGRPKWMIAFIYSKHLKSNLDRQAGRNLVIPPELGGPTNEAYNTFPQSEKNFEEWKQVTDQFQSYLRAKRTGFWVFVTFTYESPSATKPYGFYYIYRADRIVYGFIPN